MNLEPIGKIRSCFGGKFGVPRQPGLCPSAYGSLVFVEKFRSAEAVRGMEGFSHLWLIFGFHETSERGWKPTVRPPRLGGNDRIGVFASRSTFRPNALGLSLVRLESIDFESPAKPVLHLGGLDLIDGTPVFDIKPYLPYAESISDAKSGFASAEIPQLEVRISDAAADNFRALPSRDQAVIREALAHDPRPAIHTSPGACDSSRLYGTTLCGKNIRFSVTGNLLQIESIISTA